MNDFYKRGMQTALFAAKNSQDPDTQTGCAIFDVGAYNPLCCGTNRLPYGIEPKFERVNRPGKYQWLEHAERNAIYGQHASDLSGTIMFLNWFPCADCARAIVQANIIELVYVIKPERMNDSRYNFETSKAILEAGSVKLTPYEESVDEH